MLKFNKEKVEEVVLYFANELGEMATLHHIQKAIWLADMTHMANYGRPIVGGRYMATKYGIESWDEVGGSAMGEVEKLTSQERCCPFNIDIATMKISPLRYPSRRTLSQSDWSCLEMVSHRLQGKTVDDIEAMEHTRTWREITNDGQRIRPDFPVIVPLNMMYGELDNGVSVLKKIEMVGDPDIVAFLGEQDGRQMYEVVTSVDENGIFYTVSDSRKNAVSSVRAAYDIGHDIDVWITTTLRDTQQFIIYRGDIDSAKHKSSDLQFATVQPLSAHDDEANVIALCGELVEKRYGEIWRVVDA